MRVTAELVARQLNQCKLQDLPRLILLNGNEPLFIEETLDAIRKELLDHGFSERIKYQLDSGFDWSKLSPSGQSMSLFSDRRSIELRIPGKAGIAGTKAITEYCDNPPEDDILVIIMPLLDKRQRQAKWIKSVESVGWVVDSYELSAQQFPQWLSQRLQSRALRVENGVIESMSQQLEGNVLAAAQEIDKLKVLATEGAVTLDLLNRSMADQARFDVYVLADTCLSGDLVKTRRIIKRLQTEGVEPVIVVWALVRELRTMANIADALQRGQSRAQVYQSFRIWRKKEPIASAALQRISLQTWYALLQQAACLDQAVKGQRFDGVGTIWHQIEQLCVSICGVEILPLTA